MSLTTLKVTGKVEAGFRTEIDCGHPFVIDQPKAAMGNNEGPNPLDVFLSSLAGCFCAIGRIIANQKKLDVKSIKAAVEGDIDKNFLLGKTEEGRAGFREIRVNIEIEAPMTHEEKVAFVSEIERRCPVADNIARESIIVPVVH